jgi:uncharacterized protein YceK
MRKITFLLAAIVTLTISACGSGSTAQQAKDSTSVKADTTAKTAADSTAGEWKAQEGVK